MSESANLKQALAYAAFGWHVFPVWSCHVNGTCRCPKGASCPRPGKHPQQKLVPRGHLHATTDEATIRSWWSSDPGAGIGIAVAPSRLVVLDVDPQHGGDASLGELEHVHGVLASEIRSRTQGGGEHRFFRAPSGLRFPGTLGEGLDLKSTGYICAPATRGRKGVYAFHPHKSPLAPDHKSPSSLPEYIARLGRPAGYQPPASAATPILLEDQWNDLREALGHIEASDYDTWVHVGLALRLHDDRGFELWEAWSRSCPEKFDLEEARRKWVQDLADARGEITYRSIFHLAAAKGWKNGGDSGPERKSAWDAPADLFQDLLPAPFDPYACLPHFLARWADVHGQASGLGSVGFAFAALPVLAAATNRTVRMRLGPGHDVPILLWSAVVGRTGAGKSPAMIAAHKPLSELNAEDAIVHKALLQEWKETKGVRQDSPPVRSNTRYLGDTTPEALVRALSRSAGARILLHHDEGSGWLNAMGRYAAGTGDAARSTYLSAWLGLQNHTVSRITREDEFIPELGVSLLIGITPNKLKDGLREASSEGLLGRMLLCVIERRQRVAVEASAAEELAAVDKSYSGAVRRLTQHESVELRFCKAAQAMFDEERAALGDDATILEDTNPGLAAMLAKSSENLGRLAALYSMLSPATVFSSIKGLSTNREVGVEELTLAKAFMGAAIDHANAAYRGSLLSDEATKVARQCALKILRLHLKDSAFTEVTREQFMKVAEFKNAERQVQSSAIDLLRIYHWLVEDRTIRARNGGRFGDGTRWLVNPLVFDGRFRDTAVASERQAAEVHRVLVSRGGQGAKRQSS